MKRFPFLIAKRYLFSRRGSGFIRVISLISVIGVTVGVAALIVVLSVFNGFNGLVTNILIGFDPHVRISLQRSAGPDVRHALESKIRNDVRIAAVSATVSGKGMLISHSATKVVMIRGLETEKIPAVSGVNSSMLIGSAKFPHGKSEIVLGYSLADKLGVSENDTVFVVTTAGVQDVLTGIGQPKLFALRVAGIYEAKNKEYDGVYAFTSFETASRLYDAPQPLGYDIRCASIDDADAVVQDLRAGFDPNIVTVQSWYDLHRDLYSVMQVERWTAFIILTLIIAVASFNLLGSMTMTVIEKTRDIGILKAMGATRGDLRTIFRLEGILVGITGSVLGVSLGTAICWVQKTYGIFALDTNVYIIPAIPIEMRTMDIILVPFSAIVLCSIAAYYPSARAARLEPSDAVRWE